MLKKFNFFTWSQFIGLDDDIDEFDEDKGDIAVCTHSTSAPGRSALLLALELGDLRGIPQWLAELKISIKLIDDHLGVTDWWTSASCRKLVTDVH